MVYLESGANQAVRDWWRVRGTWTGPLLCSVRKDGKIEAKGITAQAIYRALAKRGRKLASRVSHLTI
jgi:hypothetical protein